MYFWLLGIALTIIGLIYGLLSYLKGNDGYWSQHGIEGIRSGEVVTLWERLRLKNTAHDLDNMFYRRLKSKDRNLRVGGIMELRSPVLVVIDPDLIKAVTVKDFDHFINRRSFPIPKNDTSQLGKSVFFLENQEWKDMRATLSPTFSTGKIRRMFGILQDSAEQMTNYLKSQIENTSLEDVELKEVCGRYTMNVIASSAFGIESNVFTEKESPFYRMGQGFQNQFKGVKMFKLALFMVLPKLMKCLGLSFLDQTVSEFFKDVITKTVKHRVESGEKRDDFVQLLLDTRSEPSGGSSVTDESQSHMDIFEKDAQLKNTKTSKVYLTDDLILAQSILFFLAGFDTTETLLILAAYELALNPDVQEKLWAEIKEAEQNEGKLSYDIINSLEYLDMVVNETLRKYPPLIRLERRCAKDYKLPGIDYVVKKEDLILIPTYGIHHDAEIYPNPEKFDPTRFTAENMAQRNPYNFIPFGVGPRNCIAMRFALMGGKTAIAELVKSFVISPITKTSIPIEFSKTGALKPANGMWLKLSTRA